MADITVTGAAVLYSGFNTSGYEEQSLLFLTYLSDSTSLVLFGEIQKEDPYMFAYDRKVSIYGTPSVNYVAKKTDITISIKGISKESYDILKSRFFKQEKFKVEDNDNRVHSNMAIVGDRLGLAKFYGYNGERLYEGTLKLEQS